MINLICVYQNIHISSHKRIGRIPPRHLGTKGFPLGASWKGFIIFNHAATHNVYNLYHVLRWFEMHWNILRWFEMYWDALYENELRCIKLSSAPMPRYSTVPQGWELFPPLSLVGLWQSHWSQMSLAAMKPSVMGCVGGGYILSSRLPYLRCTSASMIGWPLQNMGGIEIDQDTMAA